MMIGVRFARRQPPLRSTSSARGMPAHAQRGPKLADVVDTRASQTVAETELSVATRRNFTAPSGPSSSRLITG